MFVLFILCHKICIFSYSSFPFTLHCLTFCSACLSLQCMKPSTELVKQHWRFSSLDPNLHRLQVTQVDRQEHFSAPQGISSSCCIYLSSTSGLQCIVCWHILSVRGNVEQPTGPHSLPTGDAGYWLGSFGASCPVSAAQSCICIQHAHQCWYSRTAQHQY